MAKSKKVKATDEVKIIYPETKAILHVGENALSVDDCKRLLGWQEEEEGTPFKSDYLLIDRNGRKVRCTNNVRNRPLYMSSVESLVQEHLQKRWRVNGEPIIIGKTGAILNGQHTLISVVLAEQDRTGKQVLHWEDKHTGPIVLEKLVVYGIEESDDVVNTMDTCKPRSLSDVIYRSEFFSKKNSGDRRIASRMTDYAIRLLWKRVGAMLDAFAPRRTHSESLDFLSRHSRLLRCVNHILEENQEHSIDKVLGAGYAAGLLYLQGSSNSDGDKYRSSDPPTEKKLNWENWDKACEFWVALSAGSKEMDSVRKAISELADGTGGSLDERMGVLVKAWTRFKEEKKIERKNLVLEYETDEEGNKRLVDFPSVGGIDLGDPKGHEEEDDQEEEETTEQKSTTRKANRGRRSDTSSFSGGNPPSEDRSEEGEGNDNDPDHVQEEDREESEDMGEEVGEEVIEEVTDEDFLPDEEE